MVDIQMEKNERLVEALRDYFIDAEKNGKIDQACAITLENVPEVNRGDIDKECGHCVGAHLAYFFAKNPEFGISVKPWLFRHDNNEDYDDFFNSLSMKVDRDNIVRDSFTEYYVGNTWVDDWYDDDDIRDHLGRPDDYAGTKDDWEQEDTYLDSAQEMLNEAVTVEAADAMHGSCSPQKWEHYMTECGGNDDMTRNYGEIYFYKDGVNALAKYIHKNSQQERYYSDCGEQDARDDLTFHLRDSVNAYPWSSMIWSEDPHDVLPDLVRTMLVPANQKEV